MPQFRSCLPACELSHSNAYGIWNQYHACIYQVRRDQLNLLDFVLGSDLKLLRKRGPQMYKDNIQNILPRLSNDSLYCGPCATDSPPRYGRTFTSYGCSTVLEQDRSPALDVCLTGTSIAKSISSTNTSALGASTRKILAEQLLGALTKDYLQRTMGGHAISPFPSLVRSLCSIQSAIKLWSRKHQLIIPNLPHNSEASPPSLHA
ncbi:hypothetical protein BDW74DRAFT_13249 [Aspergillus multicolor]|uniref:uncharacterized protein n=1 Tax=Aspergillus multicolor TaxID=41759 RepID=UPI003CCCF025